MTAGRTFRVAWHRHGKRAPMAEWIVPASGPFRRLGFFVRWRRLAVLVQWRQEAGS